MPARKITHYEYVKSQIEAGLWEKTQALFGRNAVALDLYFRIYELVLEYYPKRQYGYATQFVNNEEIMNKIGGGYSQDLDFPEVMEAYTVRKAVMIMERTFYF